MVRRIEKTKLVLVAWEKTCLPKEGKRKSDAKVTKLKARKDANVFAKCEKGQNKV